MSSPCRIGVDARELLGEPTGVGRYLGELLARWTARPEPAPRFILYTPEPLPTAWPPDRVDTRVIGAGRGTWWEQTHLRRAVRSDAPDVFFAPAYTAPLHTGVPLGVTIHDISFVAHPEWFRRSEGLRRRWLTRRAARTASVIFTDSEFSRSELQRHLGVSGSRVVVVAPGAPRAIHAEPVPREPLVLFVGSLFNRRNLPDLIAAFALATSRLPTARLAIVGDDRTYPPQNLRAVAEAHGVAARTDLLRYITDQALTSLYARASVFAFLSEYEGFGLTPLEAMAAGIPPVVLDTPVAREVYGDAAMYAAPGDVAGIARLLEQSLTDPASTRAVVSYAPAVLARYSWDQTAARTLEHLQRIATR